MYNKQVVNKTRLRKEARSEKRQKKEEKLAGIKEILLKNKNLVHSSNIEGYALDENDNVIVL